MTGKSHIAISVHLPSDGQRQPGADAATVNGNTDEDIQYRAVQNNFLPATSLPKIRIFVRFGLKRLAFVYAFLPCDATQRAVMPEYVVCLSVRL